MAGTNAVGEPSVRTAKYGEECSNSPPSVPDRSRLAKICGAGRVCQAGLSGVLDNSDDVPGNVARVDACSDRVFADKPAARERSVDEEAVRPADGIRVGEATALDDVHAQCGQEVTTHEVRDREVWFSGHTWRRRRRRRAVD